MWVAVVERHAVIRWKKNYKKSLEIKVAIAIRHDGLVVVFLDTNGQVVA